MATSTDFGPGLQAINVTPDGKVKKEVLEEGDGDCPPRFARCLVHYVGQLAESGDVFMDTRKESESGEPVSIVAGRDSSAREVGINLGVASMKRGERCRLTVSPEYGYGEQGSFSFPTVPPNAHLVYDITLVAFEEESDEKPLRAMLYEERLEAAERRRSGGNAAFKEGRYEEALEAYRLGLSYIDDDFMLQLEGRYLQAAESVKGPLQLNVAAALLALGRNAEAVAACNEVLAQEPNNAKALFRRGKARAAMGATEDARSDLQRAQALAPDDQGIARELRAVARTEKAELAATRQLFGGKFKDKGLGGLYDGNNASSEAGDGNTGGQVAASAQSSGLLSTVLQWFAWVWGALTRLFGVPLDRCTMKRE